MKTYEERTRDILGKADKLKKTRRKKIIAALSAACCLAVVLGLVLFLPYNTQPPSVQPYEQSEYYDLICALNPLTYRKPSDKNNFENWFGDLDDKLTGEAMPPAADAPDGYINAGANGSESYVEVTDNQVAGVIEGDRIKRSDKHIFYLTDNGILRVYSIAQEQSALVGEFDLNAVLEEENSDTKEDLNIYLYSHDIEMFLSSDCSTVTLVFSCYRKEIRDVSVCVLSLDVTEPEKITETGRLFLTGGYLSARVVGDELLLMSLFRVKNNPDFEKESDYLPQYGEPGQMQSIPMDNIIIPDDPTAARYTVITRIDPKSLAVRDTAALLSFASEVYVSGDTIVASRGYSDKTELEDGYFRNESRTELCCISYEGGEFKNLGSIDVAGSVLNQYSMDIHKDILRVVTTTSESKYRERVYSNGDIASSEIYHEPLGRGTNASLYCIDIKSMELIASVEKFAPPGETVCSVRFDGDYAYVCTAIKVQVSDPVFFFDLSDLSNITWKDTGNISGFSSSLVNFGNGYLLGIGFGSSWDLKIEVYEEAEESVLSVCHYTAQAGFSQDYKSYLIDREHGYIGLGYHDWRNTGEAGYLLLHFDGYQIHEVFREVMPGYAGNKRAVIIDGWIYLLGSEFVVKPL